MSSNADGLEQLPSVPIRTFECVVDINGPLEGTLQDWPANIQDAIYDAMEKMADKVKLPLAVVYSACKYDASNDVPATKDDPGLRCGNYFIHVILSEIVVRDMRFSSEEMMKRAYDEIVKTRMH